MFSIVEMGLSFMYFITLVHYDSFCSFVCLFEIDFSVVSKLFKNLAFLNLFSWLSRRLLW